MYEAACIYVDTRVFMLSLLFFDRYRYSSGIVPELLSRNVHFHSGTHQRDLGYKRRTRERIIGKILHENPKKE